VAAASRATLRKAVAWWASAIPELESKGEAIATWVWGAQPRHKLEPEENFIILAEGT